MSALTTPAIDEAEIAAMAILAFGPQPIYSQRIADRLERCERHGLVQTGRDVPAPPGDHGNPIFFAQLTRLGRDLMSRPEGGEQ